MLRKVEVALAQCDKVGVICRGLGVSEQSYYRWRREYSGPKIDQAKRLKDLERDNNRLHKAVYLPENMRRAAELRPVLYRPYAKVERPIGHTLSPSGAPLPDLTGVSPATAGHNDLTGLIRTCPQLLRRTATRLPTPTPCLPTR